MSAYVVGREHVAYLVQAASSLHVGRADWDGRMVVRDPGTDRGMTADELGQMLWDENLRSVAHRYPDCDPLELPGPIGEHYVYQHEWCIYTMPELEPVQVLKALSCYEYQSCEHDGWNNSPAREFCERLRHRAIAYLPGYGEAAWNIEPVAAAS